MSLRGCPPAEKSRIKQKNTRTLSYPRFLVTRTGDGAEAPPVADAARRRKGKSQAGKAAPKLPPHAPITFLGDELVEFDSPLFAPKQKNQPSLLT